MAAEPENGEPVADARSSRPYILSPMPLKTLARRLASVVCLIAIDIAGLVIGLYAALALRSLIVDPKPILWGLLWDHETSWLAFLILLLVLVFWQAGLYKPRETREAAARVVPSVILVAALSLAFAIGTGQHFTTFGLYVAARGVRCRADRPLSWKLRTADGLPAARGRRTPQGDDRGRGDAARPVCARRSAQVAAASTTTSSRECEPGPELERALARESLDEIVVADAGLDDARLLEIVEAAHRRGVKVRVAPRTTELLIERGEYVPGQGVPLFELRPPIFAGAQWATKRTFDIVVGSLIVIVGLPIWIVLALAIKLSSPGSIFYSDRRIGLGERPFEMLKFRTMVAGAAEEQPALERENEASGALFKIRDDPRVTRIGRLLRRFSIDEVPNVINVLRGEMSLVGPRPLPVRDYDRLEEWHRRRYHVLPGMTGLWQVAGRSDLTFDDLVRLDFYYIENWSIWLDISILLKTPLAVFARTGAY